MKRIGLVILILLFILIGFACAPEKASEQPVQEIETIQEETVFEEMTVSEQTEGELAQEEISQEQSIQEETTEEQPAPPPVNLTMKPTINDNILTVDGTANLPDGALLAYEIRHEGLPTRTDVPIEKMFSEGNVEVIDGIWRISTDLSGWPSGEIEIWVAFQTILKGAEQPKEILEKYGELGENITGPQSVKTGDLKRAEIITTVAFS